MQITVDVSGQLLPALFAASACVILCVLLCLFMTDNPCCDKSLRFFNLPASSPSR